MDPHQKVMVKTKTLHKGHIHFGGRRSMYFHSREKAQCTSPGNSSYYAGKLTALSARQREGEKGSPYMPLIFCSPLPDRRKSLPWLVNGQKHYKMPGRLPRGHRRQEVADEASGDTWRPAKTRSQRVCVHLSG